MFLIIIKIKYPTIARLNIANIILNIIYILIASLVNIIIGLANYTS
jgi:hypothetical protein